MGCQSNRQPKGSGNYSCGIILTLCLSWDSKTIIVIKGGGGRMFDVKQKDAFWNFPSSVHVFILTSGMTLKSECFLINFKTGKTCKWLIFTVGFPPHSVWKLFIVQNQLVRGVERCLLVRNLSILPRVSSAHPFCLQGQLFEDIHASDPPSPTTITHSGVSGDFPTPCLLS